MKLLLLEDDPNVAVFITKGLREAGFVVEHTTQGEVALSLAQSEEYDAAVLDIMVPGLSGLSVVQTLREQKNPIPVLILSAKQTLKDRVSGIELGADDYLTKPFSFLVILRYLYVLGLYFFDILFYQEYFFHCLINLL